MVAIATEARYRYIDEAGEHLHTLDGHPLIGTSTAVGVIAKPLTWWAAGMALTPLGWLNRRKSTAAERRDAALNAIDYITTLSAKQYEAKLEECYRAHDTRKKDTAVSGIDMHTELERYVKTCIYDNAGHPALWAESAETSRFADWATDHVSEFLWSEGHCYSEQLWTGGICDCGALLKNRKLAAIDFKSSKEAYFSQYVQVAGYATQIAENGVLTPSGQQILEPVQAEALIVFPFGCDDDPSILYNVAAYQEAFSAAVTLHKLKQAYES